MCEKNFQKSVRRGRIMKLKPKMLLGIGIPLLIVFIIMGWTRY